jgi:hypothetical protein
MRALGHSKDICRGRGGEEKNSQPPPPGIEPYSSYRPTLIKILICIINKILKRVYFKNEN